MSDGYWAPTGFNDCVKYVHDECTVVWIGTGERTFMYALNADMMSTSVPWPEGMDLEEVKAYTVTLWRLTR